MDAGDYRETYRSAFGGVHFDDLVVCFRQRKGYVVVGSSAGDSPLLTIEAKPVPPSKMPDVDLGAWGFKVALDPRRGMMPAVIEVLQPVKGVLQLYRRMTVNQWKDLGNGVWVPTKATTHIFYLDNGTNPDFHGQVANEIVLTVDEARSSWNKSVSEGTLRNPLPAGTKVMDTERGVQYVTGKADPGVNLADLAKHARDVAPIITTQPEKPLWGTWLLRGAVLLVATVALVLGGWFVRKRWLGKTV
jgi:hypothetical protein